MSGVRLHFTRTSKLQKVRQLPWPRRRIGCLIGTQSNAILPLLQKEKGERPVGMGLPAKPVALHHTIWPVIVCQHVQRPKLFIDDALGDKALIQPRLKSFYSTPKAKMRSDRPTWLITGDACIAATHVTFSTCFRVIVTKMYLKKKEKIIFIPKI